MKFFNCFNIFVHCHSLEEFVGVFFYLFVFPFLPLTRSFDGELTKVLYCLKFIAISKQVCCYNDSAATINWAEPLMKTTLTNHHFPFFLPFSVKVAMVTYH